jgi:hypothetical protein
MRLPHRGRRFDRITYHANVTQCLGGLQVGLCCQHDVKQGTHCLQRHVGRLASLLLAACPLSERGPLNHF